MLNAAGGFRLDGLLLRNEENSLFNHVVSLVTEGKFTEAEEASSEFPFEEDFIATEIVSAIDADDV